MTTHQTYTFDSVMAAPMAYSEEHAIVPSCQPGFRFPQVVNKSRHFSERYSIRTEQRVSRRSESRESTFGGELQAFCRRTKRYFSEDSGFSSSGSSVSSVGDDVGHLFGPFSYSYGSGTVAAVLAAGAASDSEGTDVECLDSSDEEGDDVFEETSCPPRETRTSEKEDDMAVAIRRLVVIGRNWAETSQVKALHLGRDLLDLGSNLRTRFPVRATHLPDINLPMYMENRSQYHRLGKFGSSENFHMMKCIKGCGFSFPLPTME